MTMARWQRTIVDDKGNLLPGASIEVREAGGGSLVDIKSDRAGTTPLGNPFTAHATTGFAAFFVAGGAYQITASLGGFSVTWDYVAIGTAQEMDADDVGGAVAASAAEVRAGTEAAKYISPDSVSDASAVVTLSDAATIAVDWSAFLHAEVTLTADRILGNPTNGIPGTTRTILCKANSGTDRTLTFGNQYGGGPDKPSITNIDNTQWSLLTILCLTTTHFIVTRVRADAP